MDPLVIPGVLAILAVLWLYLWADMRQTDKMNRPFREAEPHHLSALSVEEQNRKLEHRMGIGPFAGKEDWCDLTECKGGRDHFHADVDEETRTGRPVPIEPGWLPF